MAERDWRIPITSYFVKIKENLQLHGLPNGEEGEEEEDDDASLTQDRYWTELNYQGNISIQRQTGGGGGVCAPLRVQQTISFVSFLSIKI